MIVDTSAIVAIVLGEADAGRYAQALAAATSPKMSAATWVETTIVLDSRTITHQRRRVDDLFRAARIEIVPLDLRQAQEARLAYQDLGRGSGHPAELNFGDCFSYALHRVTGEPLLFKGDDFAAAAVPSALPD